jgi:hypothetical protein
VTAEYVRSEEPDVLIVAVGAEPYMPIKGKNVISAGDIDTAEVGKTGLYSAAGWLAVRQPCILL